MSEIDWKHQAAIWGPVAQEWADSVHGAAAEAIEFERAMTPRDIEARLRTLAAAGRSCQAARYGLRLSRGAL